jgi:hypothetical protein
VITRRGLLGLVPIAALGALGLRWLRSDTRGETLFVYNAVAGNASLVRELDTDHAQLVELPGLKLGRWNVRIGVLDDHLLMLDTESRRIHALRLDWLRKHADQPDPLAPDALRTSPLHAGLVPYRALIHGQHVLVDYFAANRIEIYRWQRSSGLSYVGEQRLPNPRPLGLSDIVIRGDRLLVAASGVSCLARICPKETAPDPHVFVFQLDRDRDVLGAASADLHPSNANAAGLYVHPDTDAAFVISAGDYRGGYSSIQRILADGRLGPEVRLAANAGAARGFPLDSRTFLILQFSGEHVFLVDAVDARVLAILRFDGKNFAAIEVGNAPLSERPRSDLQDVLPDPAVKGRFFIVDSKQEQLLHVTFRPPNTLELLSKTSLRTAAFRSSPSWALWVPAAPA